MAPRQGVPLRELTNTITAGGSTVMEGEPRNVVTLSYPLVICLTTACRKTWAASSQHHR